MGAQDHPLVQGTPGDQEVRVRVTTGELQWGTRKAAQVRIELMRYLAANGAPGSTWEELGPEEAAPEPPRWLKLQCKPCAIYWFAEAFTPCLQCGAKATVHKMSMYRVHLPEAVAPGMAIPIDAEPIPAITMVET